MRSSASDVVPPGDADALAAARTLSQAISEADLSWDDLLLPPDMDDPPSFEDVAGLPADA